MRQGFASRFKKAIVNELLGLEIRPLYTTAPNQL
jgi:hypothetical protein